MNLTPLGETLLHWIVVVVVAGIVGVFILVAISILDER